MLIFAATDSGGGRELWRSDSATGETVRVRDITAGSGSTEIDEASALGGVVYFGALPGTSGAKNTLWRSDGTALGTYPLFDLDAPRSFTSAGGKLYFVAGDAQGRAVFAYDPATGAAPVRLTPVHSGAFPLSPSTLYAAGGAVYAVAVAGTGRGDHVELWKTDGTAGGTAKVRDVQPIVAAGTSPGLGAYWVGGRFALGASATHLFFPAWRPEWGLEPHALPLADPSGAVRGVVFDDRNRDGVRGPGEGGLAGRTVFADFDGDGVVDADEPVATTGPGGAYEITSLDARAYVVRTVVPAGWAATGPGGAEVVMGGGPVEAVDFAVGDVAPPAATSGGTAAARPTAEVRVTFTEDVSAALSPAALELTNVTTGQAVDALAVRVEFDPATLTAVFTFPGLPGGLLPDGNYTARVAAGSVADASGNPLASEFGFAFHVLAADANGDRAVDFNDMVVLAQNYNQTGKTFADGDFNYDGSVDFNDLVLLAQRYNTTLAAPAPPPAPLPAAVSPLNVVDEEEAAGVFSRTRIRPAPAPAPARVAPPRRR
jgi:ELWxxDGT repeat protein